VKAAFLNLAKACRRTVFFTSAKDCRDLLDKIRRQVVALANEDSAQTELAIENDLTIGPDGWVKIAPFGDFIKERTVRLDNGQTEQQAFIQRLDKEAAQRMVDKFNSVAGRIKRFVQGVPIFKQHPDLGTHSPEVLSNGADQDKNTYGVFGDLEVRGDGFYGRPILTDAGRVAVENEGLKFLSPFWRGRVVGETPNKFKIFSPDVLLSAGLTKYPNIKGGETLANATDHKIMREKLIALLATFGIALANAAKDDEVETAIKQLGEKAKSADALANEKQTLATARATAETALTNEQSARTQLQTQLTERETSLANERKDHIELLLDNSIMHGRITIAERSQWATALANEKEFAAKKKELLSRAPASKTAAITAGAGERKGEIEVLANEAERREKVQELVAEKTSKGMPYDQAFAQVRKQQPGLFGQMKQPKAD